MSGTRVLVFRDLKLRKGIPYSRPTIDEMVEAGRFPTPFWLSERRKAWFEHEIDDWLAERASMREQAEK
jgi:predicted DNA-binding transcriptional regulator AlpA